MQKIVIILALLVAIAAPAIAGDCPCRLHIVPLATEWQIDQWQAGHPVSMVDLDPEDVPLGAKVRQYNMMADYFGWRDCHLKNDIEHSFNAVVEVCDCQESEVEP